MHCWVKTLKFSQGDVVYVMCFLVTDCDEKEAYIYNRPVK